MDALDTARWVPEPAKRAGRSAFERDRARVLHSSALRRLAGKTQVVVPGESDFPRTRLTHSLECAQIGRELGAALGADPDLVETACLAHDLGHPPFGHTGESALAELAEPCGGFEGNAQSLRLLTRLEAKTFAPSGRSVGLNLTRASLDAACKYPWTRARGGGPKFGVYEDDLDVFAWFREPAPGEDVRCLEAQVMDWSDDIAYSVHDIEDAVVSGLMHLRQLADGDERAAIAQRAADRNHGSSQAEFTAALERLVALPYWLRDYDGSLRSVAALKNMTSQLIGRFAQSAEQATRAAYGGGPLRRYGANLVVPETVRAECEVLKTAAERYMMTTDAATRRYAIERETVHGLVSTLSERPEELDPVFGPEHAAAPDDAGRLRVVLDQVAALTDASAVAWHTRLTR